VKKASTEATHHDSTLDDGFQEGDARMVVMSVATLSIVNGDSNRIGGQELRYSSEQRQIGDRTLAFPTLRRESGPIFSVTFAM
jgi:hypothetical protein